MIKTVTEFENVVNKKKNVLSDVYALKLLNDEGVRTLEAYTNILKITPFYDNLKEFYENEKLKSILTKYEDCSQIKHIVQFLEKSAK